MTFIVERLVELRRHLDHLEELWGKVGTAADLRADLSLHNDVFFSLLTVCQLVIDISGELAARHGLRATIVVLDNDGGGIFSFLPIAAHGAAVGFEEHFRTPHGLDLAAVASAYGARAARVGSWEHFRTAFKEALAGDRLSVLVIPVDHDRNVARHREIQRAVATALERLAWPL